MRTTLRALAGMALLGLVATAAPVGPAAASGQSTRTSYAAACKINDGVATTGSQVGANPVRYEYGNSPYVGARYNSCTDVIKVYFGGYTNLTHYNVIYGSRQYELAAGPAKVWTVTPPSYDTWVTFSVQGCIRGSWPQPSRCTRWSPTLYVQVTH